MVCYGYEDMGKTSMGSGGWVGVGGLNRSCRGMASVTTLYTTIIVVP